MEMHVLAFSSLIFVVIANLTCLEALFGADATDSGASAYATKLSFAVILGMLHQNGALIQFGDILPEIQECWTDYTNQASTLWQDEHNVSMTEHKVHLRCMEKFMWKAHLIKWGDHNVTEDNLAWLNSLLMPLVQSIRKDRDPDDLYPPSGFRRRREYRRLSDGERNAFHNAVNVLKRSGRYDVIAHIHTGYVITQAHCGPNFYSWHRIYLIIMEEALRQIDRRIAIPYWDSSLDSELNNPADSIIWSPPFLGNGDGFITSGPFANWSVGNTSLLRNLGRQQIDLFTKENINLTLSRCKLEEISQPFGSPRYNMDYYHMGGHYYVGGHMADLATTAYDPLFFMHHSFIDYLLEQFRINQVNQCNINPVTDYPNVTGIHGPNWPMHGFPQILNIDGFQSHWTRYWYGYERAPFCSRLKPDCGTPYLRCNVRKRRCVTKVRLITAESPIGELITAPPSTFKALTTLNTLRSNKEQDSIMTFEPTPTGVIPCGEPSKRELRVRRSARVKSAAKTTSGASSSSKQFRSPASSKATPGVVEVSATSTAITTNSNMNLSFPFSPPVPFLASLGGHVASKSWRSHIWQDGSKFAMQTSSLHVKEMVYIPTKIIHVVPFRTKKQYTVHSQSSYGAQLRRTCKKKSTRLMNVSVHSHGLNYVGTYRNKVQVKVAFFLQESSATTFIAVKKPELGTSEVLLSAFDECGNICQAECISDGTNPAVYHPCTGVLRVTSQDPAMFTETVTDALRVISRMFASDENGSAEDVRIIFRCWVLNDKPRT